MQGAGCRVQGAGFRVVGEFDQSILRTGQVVVGMKVAEVESRTVPCGGARAST